MHDSVALQSLMLELWKPAVLLFALMRGGQPIAGVKVTLLRCRSPEACFPAYDPEAYPDGCVPLVTNIAGTANFYIWPPLRDDGKGVDRQQNGSLPTYLPTYLPT